MKDETDIIDTQAVGERIVSCPKCSSRNRIRCDSPTAEYRCGNCHHLLLKPLPLRSPVLAFVLTFLTGPLGFFYVSWRTGVMSCIAFALGSLIWIGLNVTSIAGWPIGLPYLVIEKSFAPFIALFYALLQQAFLGFWCATLTIARNNSIQFGDGAGFATGHRLFRLSVAFPYGFLTILPWALNDFISGILCVIHADFGYGIALLLMPHVWIALIGYIAGLAIVSVLTRLGGSGPWFNFFRVTSD